MKAVAIENVSKLYRFYQKPIDSLKEWVFRRSYHTPVWALSDISFSVLKGETLGVIGTNGAGKSTLLKLLAQTIVPTMGDVVVKGRVSAILELGSGFHPEYSGIDNVRIGCAMLGMSGKEIDARMPEIIAFSELGDAVYRPVKTYSSGMYVRLAFSVVTAVDPEVLIIDEALSVGDQAFQKKSLDRIRSFIDQGRTLVFCSHNLYQVNSLCERVLWLENGRLKMLGPANDVTAAYQDSSREQSANVKKKVEKKTAELGALASISDVELSGHDGNGSFVFGDDLILHVMGFGHDVAVADLSVGIVIVRNDKEHVYGTSTEIENLKLTAVNTDGFEVKYSVTNLPLLSGKYSIYVYLTDLSGLHIYDMREDILPFSVRQETREIGLLRLNHHWTV